jgi:hypothetical protein
MKTDWEYGQRYNAQGEWNPRLILDERTQQYVEPDELGCTCDQLDDDLREGGYSCYFCYENEAE